MIQREPIRNARRRRRQGERLRGRTPCCPYCGETAPECLELHHVVGRKLDRELIEVRCRNCHRKIEFQRDLAGLTSNGLWHVKEKSDSEILKLRLLGLAEARESEAVALRRWAKSILTENTNEKKEE